MAYLFLPMSFFMGFSLSMVLSWYFEDSSHRDGLMEGLDGVQ
jgi:hypothetical protein